MQINAQNRTLPDWFSMLRSNQVMLPRFQRFEAWGHANVGQMLNTILRELPLGALLVLNVGNEELFKSRPIKGALLTGGRVFEHLLDGQQRLTGLWRALHNDYEERTYVLRLAQDEESQMKFFIDSIGRWKHNEEKEFRPPWVNSPVELWKRKMIPLDLCAPGELAQANYKDWARKAIPDAEEREYAKEKRDAVSLIFATFNLPYLSLPTTTSRETALDVFIKMNTSAAQLTAYDIVVAQVEDSLEQSLHDLIARAKQSCPTISAYYPPEGLVLYASALLQERAPTNANYMAKDFGKSLIANWDMLVKGISRTVEFLEQERIFDAQRLPTDVVIPVLVALCAIAPSALDAGGRARSIMQKYIWRAFFSNRYEKATSSRSLSDFMELKALILRNDASQPTIFDDEQHPLPQEQELLRAGWPAKKDRLARAILAIALKQGGIDLADGSMANRQNLQRREYHHLFPQARLKEQNVSGSQIFCALNCALVTWQTNRDISAKQPERYLAERKRVKIGDDEIEIGDDDIRMRLKSHLIPFDEMVAGNYDEFCQARATIVSAEMLALCNDSAHKKVVPINPGGDAIKLSLER